MTVLAGLPARLVWAGALCLTGHLAAALISFAIITIIVESSDDRYRR